MAPDILTGIPADLAAQLVGSRATPDAVRPPGSSPAPRRESLPIPEPIQRLDARGESIDDGVEFNDEVFNAYINEISSEPEDQNLQRAREAQDTEAGKVPDIKDLTSRSVLELITPLRERASAVTGGRNDKGENTRGHIDNDQIELSVQRGDVVKDLDRLAAEANEYGGGQIVRTTRPEVVIPGRKGKWGGRDIVPVTRDVVTVSYNVDAVPAVVNVNGEIQKAQDDLTAAMEQLEAYVQSTIFTDPQQRGICEDLALIRRLAIDFSSDTTSADTQKQIETQLRELTLKKGLAIPKKISTGEIGGLVKYVDSRAALTDGLTDYLMHSDNVSRAEDGLKQAEDHRAEAVSKSMRWATDQGEPATDSHDASIGAGFREQDLLGDKIEQIEDEVICRVLFGTHLNARFVPSSEGADEVGLMISEQSALRSVLQSLDILQGTSQALDAQLQGTPDKPAPTGRGRAVLEGIVSDHRRSIDALIALQDSSVQELQNRLDPLARLKDARGSVKTLDVTIVAKQLERRGITLEDDALAKYMDRVGGAIDTVLNRVKAGEATQKGDPDQLYQEVIDVLIGRTLGDGVKDKGQAGTPAAGGPAVPAGGEPLTGAAPTGPDAAAEAARKAAEAEAARAEREAASRELATGLDDGGSDSSWKDKFDAEEALAKDEARVRAYLEPADKKALAGLIREASKSDERFNAIIGKLDAQDPRRIILENMRIAGLSSSQMVKRANEIFNELSRVKSAFGMLSYLCATLGLPMLQRDETAEQTQGGAQHS